MASSRDPFPQDLRQRAGIAEKNGDQPATFTARDLMAQEPPPVRWAVPGLVPEGVTLLAGKAKMGKSWLVLGLCIATAAGGVALGKVPVERGEALYLALEDNPRRLYNRLGKLLDGGEPPDGFHMATEWPRLGEGGAEALDDFLRERPDARLVVVDTLKKIRPSASGNRAVYDVDYEALEPLLPLAAEHGVAILVNHHLRKMDADDPLDAISGSTGLSGGVDGALVLKRERGRADAYLYVTGREIEEERELALRWDQDLANWTIVGDAAQYKISEERAAILRVLEGADEPMTPTEVADALDKRAGTTKKTMWTMMREGWLRSDGGRYSVVNGNPGNPVTEGMSDGGPVTDEGPPGNRSGNPNGERKPLTYGENGATVTRLPRLSHDGNPPDNPNGTGGATVTDRVTGPVTVGNRRLTIEEAQQVQRLTSQGMKPELARAEVLGEEA